MKKLIWYLIEFICVLLLLIAGTTLFSVQTVTIEGVSDLKGIEAYSGSFLPFLNEEKIVSEVQNANPSITAIKVYKQYPNTLFISARKLRPVIAVKLADGYMYVSENGTVLEKNRSDSEPTLPITTFYQPLFFNQSSIGSIVDHEEIVTAASMAHSLLDLGIGVTTIDITNENMILLHTDTFNVLVTSIKDVDQQFRIFAYTYKQLRIEAKEFTSIDVRFEKPIIKL